MAVVDATEQISYEDLYARWERGSWSATEIDFARDREQWRERFDAFERRAALWNHGLFFRGLVDVSAGRIDPRRALLRRQLRPSGSLRLPRMFG